MVRFDRKKVLRNVRELAEAVSRIRAEMEQHPPSHMEVSVGINFPLIRDTLHDKIESIRAGSIDLNIQETQAIWRSMFKDKNVAYLRATSFISPRFWGDPFMVGYDAGQRESIKDIENRDEPERERYGQIARQVFDYYKIPWLDDAPFERTFIITDAQLADHESLLELIDVISRQSQYMSLRICYGEQFEAKDKRDFGIAVSKDGDIWLYELIILYNLLYGSRIVLDRDEIKRTSVAYKNIQLLSEQVPKNSDFLSVADIISKLHEKAPSVDMLRETKKRKLTKGGHRCLQCFIESERTIEDAGWHNLPENSRIWYEMLVAENEAVMNYVQLHRPQRILEVGSGPGRFIKLLSDLGLENFQEIVGIDCDSQMYKAAHKRFAAYFPTIKILKMDVQYSLPFEVDDFDFCINAMNIVGWQDNEREWLKEMLRCSKALFFTVFKHGNEDIRIPMYKGRGHDISGRGVHMNSDGQIVLGDCAVVEAVKSRSYTHDEIDGLCNAIAAVYNCAYDINEKTNDLLYLCFIYKTEFIEKLRL